MNLSAVRMLPLFGKHSTHKEINHSILGIPFFAKRVECPNLASPNSAGHAKGVPHKRSLSIVISKKKLTNTIKQFICTKNSGLDLASYLRPS